MTNGLYANKAESPLQPDISKRGTYQELFWDWNPTCKKNTAHISQFCTGSEGNLITLIPDGCRSFVFECGDNPIGRVHGIRRKNVVFALKPNTEYFAFKPYTTQGMRKGAMGWHELVDDCVDFELLYPNSGIAGRLKEAKSFKDRVAVWMDFTRKYLIDDSYNTDLVEYSELMICQSKGAIKIDKLCEVLGYTSRYCREKFKEAQGISIKSYSEIIRFQNSVRLLANDKVNALDVAYSGNYYDQSHFIKEFKKFANRTPQSFKKQYYVE